MRKLPTIFLSILALGYFLYHNFYYYDKEYGCNITLVPNLLPSNFNTKKVISIIKITSIEDYKDLCTYVNTIDKNISCGGFDGGCYEYNKLNKIYLGNDQGNIALAAAIIVHETCHAIQGHENRSFDERECYKKGNDMLKKVTVYENMPVSKE